MPRADVTTHASGPSNVTLLEDLCADPAPFREQQLGGGRWQLFFEGPGETPPALFHLASSWPKHPP